MTDQKCWKQCPEYFHPTSTLVCVHQLLPQRKAGQGGLLDPWVDKEDPLPEPTCKNGMKILPGPRLNIKTVLSTYGDFHVKDKTAVRTSYL